MYKRPNTDTNLNDTKRIKIDSKLKNYPEEPLIYYTNKLTRLRAEKLQALKPSPEYFADLQETLEEIKKSLEPEHRQRYLQWKQDHKNYECGQLSVLLLNLDYLASNSAVLFTAKSMEFLLNEFAGFKHYERSKIERMLSGIGRLARANLDSTSGKFNMRSLNNFFSDLDNFTTDKSIVDAFYCASILAENKHIEGQLDGLVLSNLMERYTKVKLVDYMASSSAILFSLTKLYKEKAISNPEPIATGLNNLFSIMPKNTQINYLEASHRVSLIERLWNEAPCDIKYLKVFLGALVSNLHTGSQATNHLKTYFVKFKSHHVALEPYFKEQVSKIAPNFIDKELHRMQLKEVLELLQGCGTWPEIILERFPTLRQEVRATDKNIPKSSLEIIILETPSEDNELHQNAPKPLNNAPDAAVVIIPETPPNQLLAPIPIPSHSDLEALVLSHESTHSKKEEAKISRPIHDKNLTEKTTVPNKKERPKNTLFDAIAQNNLRALELILGVDLNGGFFAQMGNSHGNTAVKPGLFKAFASSNQVGNEQQERTVEQVKDEKQKRRNQLVQSFLYDTPEDDLEQLIKNARHVCFDLLLYACSIQVRNKLAINNGLKLVLLHLPVRELPLMVDSFIKRGLYIHHKGIFSLITALNLRSEHSLDAKTKELITGLKIKLLQKSLEHHDKSENGNASARLKEALDNIPKSKAQSAPIEIDDDIEDVDVVVVPKKIPAQRVSNAGLFARPKIPSTVNPRYQYVSEDIQAILAARVKHQANTYVLAAVNWADNNNPNGNNLRVGLTTFMNSVAFIGRKDQDFKVLVPILVNNNHWVGICLRLRSGQATQILYFNSLNDKDLDDRLTGCIQAIISSIVGRHGYKNTFMNTSFNCLQQPDVVSCGAYLIENLYSYIKGSSWSAATPNLNGVIRARHIKLLEDERPDYLAVFSARQFGVGRTVSMGAFD